MNGTRALYAAFNNKCFDAAQFTKATVLVTLGTFFRRVLSAKMYQLKSLQKKLVLVPLP
jgi:hypothetical protein